MKNLKIISLFLMILTLGCGAGSSSSSNANSSLLAGNAGLSPLPEDLGDLPLTIPNAFRIKACPDATQGGFSNVYDLMVHVSSPNAPVIDTNNDQIPDTVVLKLYDTVPKTVIFSGQSLNQNTFPLSTVFNNGQLQPKILGGFEKDVNGVANADISTSFTTNLTAGTWPAIPTANPFSTVLFVPGSTGAIGNQPFFETSGFEGDSGFANVACPAYRSLLCPGTHVVAIYVPDTVNTIHCTQAVARIRIDP